MKCYLKRRTITGATAINDAIGSTVLVHKNLVVLIFVENHSFEVQANRTTKYSIMLMFLTVFISF